MKWKREDNEKHYMYKKYYTCLQVSTYYFPLYIEVIENVKKETKNLKKKKKIFTFKIKFIKLILNP